MQIDSSISSLPLIVELMKQDLKVFTFRQGLLELGFCLEDTSNFSHLIYGLMGIEEDRFVEADVLYDELFHSFSIRHLSDKVYLDLACANIYEHLSERFGES